MEAVQERHENAILWRIAQLAVWLLGVSILGALIFAPEIGIHAFWNILIPVAPALLVIAPGIWRNVCPMASTALLIRHMGWAKKKHLSTAWNDRLAFAGFLLLIAIIPLRHVVMDTNGPATAIAITVLALIAFAVSYVFEWKSAWCSGLCPVHPVERLYGSRALLSTSNAHCQSCEHCVLLCPDSTPSLNPLTGARSKIRRLTGSLMAGGFAGFVYGWFQVPDYAGWAGWSHLGLAYAYPLGGFAMSLVLFLALTSRLSKSHKELVVRVFACAAVSCYYWFRIPALFGFGVFPGDGMLVDLSNVVPSYFTILSQILTTTFFVWILLLRPAQPHPWAHRPQIARPSRIRFAE
ncbi:MAG: hypothetical protein L3K26_19955 [Candidatus Hydrogenedentes bacterium]|nr:hypothetical protein [Candidatus Hydrogenedentota bacterium]